MSMIVLQQRVTLIKYKDIEMTEQQKEAYKQLQKIMTYYPETNITNNQKALMKLTYKMNLNDAIVALQKLSIG